MRAPACPIPRELAGAAGESRMFGSAEALYMRATRRIG